MLANLDHIWGAAIWCRKIYQNYAERLENWDFIIRRKPTWKFIGEPRWIYKNNRLSISFNIKLRVWYVNLNNFSIRKLFNLFLWRQSLLFLFLFNLLLDFLNIIKILASIVILLKLMKFLNKIFNILSFGNLLLRFLSIYMH